MKIVGTQRNRRADAKLGIGPGRRSSKCLVAALLGSAVSSAMTGAAFAQSASAPALEADTNPNQVEEVVVTARRYEESLQSTPIAVSAFTGAGLEQAGVSSLVDAAAACIVASGAYVKAQGKKPLARVLAAAAVGVPPEIMGIGPAPAIRLLLERTGLKLDDIGCFEINEAQGAQTLAVAKELGLDISKLNVNGGAIALGHPLAATGVRLTLTLARQMQASGVRYGISSACVGGGQGIALLLENPDYY